MKQTIIMLLAAVLLGSANVFSQSHIDGYKGDVNGDGTVDVADVASVIQIMANGGWINTKPTYPVKADFTGLKIESGSSTQYIEHGRTATWEVSLAPGYVDWFSTITNCRVIGNGDIRRIISNPVDTAGFDVTATASTEKIVYYWCAVFVPRTSSNEQPISNGTNLEIVDNMHDYGEYGYIWDSNQLHPISNDELRQNNELRQVIVTDIDYDTNGEMEVYWHVYLQDIPGKVWKAFATDMATPESVQTLYPDKVTINGKEFVHFRRGNGSNGQANLCYKAVDN